MTGSSYAPRSALFRKHESTVLTKDQTLSLIGISLAIAAVARGWGRPSAYSTPGQIKETLRLLFALQTVWNLTYCLVRVSVACSLLRYGFGVMWTWLLYFMIGLQVTISSSFVVIQVAQCTPMSSNWEMIPHAKCWAMPPITDYRWAVVGKLGTQSSSPPLTCNQGYISSWTSSSRSCLST
jgi:hypothetical protein